MRQQQGTLLYPRLGDGPALALVQGWPQGDLIALRYSSDLSHKDAAPAATGGHTATVDDILRVQNSVRSVADQFGFPEPLNMARAQGFDAQCGDLLVDTMHIVPADAANRGVWTFLSVVVLPEIGPWRYPNPPIKRLLGDRRRNVLSRLWWRSYVLGSVDQKPPECTPLGEDELVQIMERPGLSGDPRVARHLQEAVWTIERNYPGLARSRVFRQVCLRLLARKSSTLLASLTDEQLTKTVEESISETVKLMKKD